MLHHRWIAILMAALLCVALLPLGALAEGSNVVQISNSNELVAAIANQQDGQTWVFTQAGTYDVFNSETNGYYSYGTNREFVFPIRVNNLTIKKADGVGEVIVTSSATPSETAGGNWHYQNFITIFGKNVSIDGLTLKSNRNNYYGTCNKLIELYEPGTDLHLSNIRVLPVENGEGTSFGGSIYINGGGGRDVGTVTIENVTMDAWLSASTVSAGEVVVSNLTQDFSNSEYAGYTYEGSYGWNPNITGANVSVSGHTIIVDGKTNLIEQVFNENLRNGATVKLSGDVKIDEMLDITQSNITLDLNGHTITASDTFKSTYANDSHLVNVTGAGVTLKNGTLKTTNQNKHALNLYGAQKATLENLTLDHTNASAGAPMVINGSDALVQGKFTMVTGANSWYAANVDSKSTGNASLEFGQNSTVTFQGQSRSNMGIVLDNSATGGHVSVVFDSHVEIESPEDFVILYNNAETGTEIDHPENAGLVQHGDEWVSEPEPEPTPTVEPTPSAVAQNPPKTGDSSHLALWMAMLALSMGCGGALLIMNLRRMNNR